MREGVLEDFTEEKHRFIKVGSRFVADYSFLKHAGSEIVRDSGVVAELINMASGTCAGSSVKKAFMAYYQPESSFVLHQDAGASRIRYVYVFTENHE